MRESHLVERRITLRLIAYWERLRRGRPMPREQDIDPADIEDLWDHCFLVHVKDLSKEDYNYTYIGSAILDAYRAGLSVEDCGGLMSPNASKLAGSYQQVIDSRKPLIAEGEFRGVCQQVVKYRQCMLPLGEEDQVLAIFGGMRFKLFSS